MQTNVGPIGNDPGWSLAQSPNVTIPNIPATTGGTMPMSEQHNPSNPSSPANPSHHEEIKKREEEEKKRKEEEEKKHNERKASSLFSKRR